MFASFLVLLAAGAASSPAQTLEVRVTSAGRPAAARVYIVDAQGKPYRIPRTVGYSRGGEVHSIVDGAATVSLPAGAYTVRAEKGPEYGSAARTVSLGAGAARVDLDVPRLHDMNARGWYSGDLHIHRAPEEMPLLLRAEDLNVGPTITRHVGNHRPVQGFPKENVQPVDALHVATLQNQEVERLRTGHGAVLLLNTPVPVEADPADLSPMDVEFCRDARRQGGFIDSEKPIWKNVPVNVALGALDSIGIVNNHFHPHAVQLDAEKWGSMEREKPEYRTVAGFAQWMMDLYYSFLNCGFRIPVSAGSASGVMPVWIGYERVYVRTAPPLDYRQWFGDLKAGRSIATNGPLLEAAVNGQPPGAEFAWTAPMRVRLDLDVHFAEPLDRLEVVLNGQVVLTHRGSYPASPSVSIAEPGWLVVRCFGRAGETIRYAHTSPFYFPRNGKLPVRRADAERWADYIRGLAATVDADHPAQATFREAEAVYRRLPR